MEEKKLSSKILIVEDDSFLVKMYLERLQDENFVVAVASNGEEGLQKAQTEKPDLILLDMILPKMNGFDFLKQIKADPALKNIPVIILSNLGQDQDIEQGRQLGAVDYLLKTNYPIQGVIDKIKEHLSPQ